MPVSCSQSTGKEVITWKYGDFQLQISVMDVSSFCCDTVQPLPIWSWLQNFAPESSGPSHGEKNKDPLRVLLWGSFFCFCRARTTDDLIEWCRILFKQIADLEFRPHPPHQHQQWFPGVPRSSNCIAVPFLTWPIHSGGGAFGTCPNHKAFMGEERRMCSCSCFSLRWFLSLLLHQFRKSPTDH